MNSGVVPCILEVEKYEKPEPKMAKQSDNGNDNDYDDGAIKEYPVTFWISFSVTAILLAFVLFIFRTKAGSSYTALVYCLGKSCL